MPIAEFIGCHADLRTLFQRGDEPRQPEWIQNFYVVVQLDVILGVRRIVPGQVGGYAKTHVAGKQLQADMRMGGGQALQIFPAAVLAAVVYNGQRIARRGPGQQTLKADTGKREPVPGDDGQVSAHQSASTSLRSPLSKWSKPCRQSRGSLLQVMPPPAVTVPMLQKPGMAACREGSMSGAQEPSRA